MKIKTKVTKVRRSPNAGWNTAIREAQRQLVLAKRRVEGLEKTIKNWTKLKNEGMSWPDGEAL